MTPDNLLIFMVWVVFIALTLALLIKVDWKDWGLVGLLILCGAVTTLLTLMNVNQWLSPQTPSLDVPGYEGYVWTWRVGAGIGGSMVLAGLMVEFYRNHPFLWQTLRRLGLGLLVILFVAGLVLWT